MFTQRSQMEEKKSMRNDTMISFTSSQKQAKLNIMEKGYSFNKWQMEQFDIYMQKKEKRNSTSMSNLTQKLTQNKL